MSNIKNIKITLFERCNQIINERIKMAEDGLKQAQEAANDETKSSAGDKYETGRAMMHLEREKLSMQLSEAIKMKKVLILINPSRIDSAVALGSIVITSTAKYFLAISAGILKVGEGTYFAISPVSPIGQQLLNKKAGDKFTFSNKKQTIESVF